MPPLRVLFPKQSHRPLDSVVAPRSTGPPRWVIALNPLSWRWRERRTCE